MFSERSRLFSLTHPVLFNMPDIAVKVSLGLEVEPLNFADGKFAKFLFADLQTCTNGVCN